MQQIRLIAAIGTPLAPDETIHVPGLEAHVEDQFHNGMTGILVGGTMGAMQLLGDATYRQLVECIVAFKSRGEMMVGVGDTSLKRTLERIEWLNGFRVDGAVVLTPYFWSFSQAELVEYFTTLADASKNPLFLYDLPALTKTNLEFETIELLSKHPNIHGIKCSGELGKSRALLENAGADFRVVVAQAEIVDILIGHGFREHLDGVFALAPFWVAQIADAAAAGNWDEAKRYQQNISALLRVLRRHGVFQAFGTILNARGIPGCFAPRPMRQLSEKEKDAVLAEPIVQRLLESSSKLPPMKPFKRTSLSLGRRVSKAGPLALQDH
jgi:4-hydroxy-tetrahydrodipicolinate synthase